MEPTSRNIPFMNNELNCSMEDLSDINFEDFVEEFNAITSEFSGLGQALIGVLSDIEESPMIKMYPNPKDLCKEKGWTPSILAAEHEKGNIVKMHLSDPVPGETPVLHVDPEIETIIKEMGFHVIAGKKTIKYRPGEFAIKTWTPEQMERINQIASASFKELSKLYQKKLENEKSDQNQLRERTVSYIKTPRPLVRNDQFPDLKKHQREIRLKDVKDQERLNDEIVQDEEHKRKEVSRNKELKSIENESEIKKLSQRKWDIKQEHRRKVEK